MNINWRSEDDEILIEFVRVNDILFNIKNKNYRQTHIKQKLWCKVGEILNKTEIDCYKRWCYVRDYYIRRKGKPGTGSSGEAAKKRSDLLSFLDSIPSSQKNSVTNVIEVRDPLEISGENNQDNSEQTPLQDQETEGLTFNGEDSSIDTYIENDSENYEEIKEKLKLDIDSIIKSNQKRKNNLHAQKRLSLLKQIVQLKPSTTQSELDETDLFFNSMAKIVKKLSRYEQVQLRMQIGSLVGNAELRCIANDSPPLSVSPKPSTSGSDYSEIAIPPSRPSMSAATDCPKNAIPLSSTNTCTVPSRPATHSIAINDQGQVYLVKKKKQR